MSERELSGKSGAATERRRNWSDAARRALIAFANTLGGTLSIGVDDAGRAVGFAGSADALVRNVALFCRDGVEPPMADLVESRTVRKEGRTVLLIRVIPGSDRPYGLRGRRFSGGVFIRDGSASVRATEAELVRLIRESRLCHEAELHFEGLQTDVRATRHCVRTGATSDARPRLRAGILHEPWAFPF